jgi:hypothetical protein
MRYRQAKKLIWSFRTPRVKSALARVTMKQWVRVADVAARRAWCAQAERADLDAERLLSCDRVDLGIGFVSPLEIGDARKLDHGRLDAGKMFEGTSRTSGCQIPVPAGRYGMPNGTRVFNIRLLLAMLAATTAGDPDS